MAGKEVTYWASSLEHLEHEVNSLLPVPTAGDR